MPKEEEYELMPHQTIARMKHELEILKKKADSKTDFSSKDVKESMEKLNANINSLTSLFKDAAEGMKAEEEEPGLKELIERVDRIEGENRRIAEGILVVADMINELKAAKPVIRPAPMPRPGPMPPRQMLPPKPMPGPMPPRQMPPPGPMPGPRGMAQAPRPAAGGPIPPPGLMPGPSPLPPLPEIRAGPKKEGLLSKIFKKK